MSADETDQPEHRRGSFGSPGARARRRGSSIPDTLRRLRPSARSASCGSAARSLMEGYYGRERHEMFTPDGWYRTGDLFHVDDDGFFYFHGRRGDMIKTAGANVSPREVEAAIARRHRRLLAHRARRPRPRARPGGRGGHRGRPTTRARPRRAAHRAARAAVGVQGAAHASSCSRRTSSRCCRAASPTCRGSRSSFVDGERLTVPALVRRWTRARTPTREFVVTDDDAITYGELDAQRRRSPARLRRRRHRQGHTRRPADAERHRVGGGRVRG